MTFWPTPLGEALISAYRRMGLDSLWLPQLRGTIERAIADVAAGRATKDQVSLGVGERAGQKGERDSFPTFPARPLTSTLLALPTPVVLHPWLPNGLRHPYLLFGCFPRAATLLPSRHASLCPWPTLTPSPTLHTPHVHTHPPPPPGYSQLCTAGAVNGHHSVQVRLPSSPIPVSSPDSRGCKACIQHRSRRSRRRSRGRRRGWRRWGHGARRRRRRRSGRRLGPWCSRRRRAGAVFALLHAPGVAQV